VEGISVGRGNLGFVLKLEAQVRGLVGASALFVTAVACNHFDHHANASAVYGATAGGLSSATLGIINGVRPKDFLGLVILGTVLGYFSGEAVGAHFTPAIDTVDVTPSLSVFGVNVPTTYLAIYAGAVNGFFTTANITGLDTHLPHWLGVVVTLSGILIPGGAVLFGAAAAPQAASTALLAPTLL
jgi:hypothetical protein